MAIIRYLGVDEAGYGPNLGPLVVSLVAFDGPESLETGDWWKQLAPAAARMKTGSGTSWVIDDSKRLWGSPVGRRELARTVHGLLRSLARQPDSLLRLFADIAARDAADLVREPWLTNEAEARPLSLAPAGGTEASFDLGLAVAIDAQARVLFPRRYNEMLEYHRSKAELEIELIRGLLADALARADSDVVIWIDHLSSRRNYVTLIEDLADGAFVATRRESPICSAYSFVSGGRDVTVEFRVKGDAVHLPIALASMLAKYLREETMASLNRYFCERIEGLAPTAGYPVDARRFLAAIAPHLVRLGIVTDDLWRRK